MNRRSAAARTLNAAKGGAKFAIAVLSGNMADDHTIDARRAICRSCGACRVQTAAGAVAPSSWCGEPFVEYHTPGSESCGCLIAGKTMVASEHCPRAKW